MRWKWSNLTYCCPQNSDTIKFCFCFFPSKMQNMRFMLGKYPKYVVFPQQSRICCFVSKTVKYVKKYFLCDHILLLALFIIHLNTALFCSASPPAAPSGWALTLSMRWRRTSCSSSRRSTTIRNCSSITTLISRRRTGRRRI